MDSDISFTTPILLQAKTDFRDSFANFVRPEWLYHASLVFIIITILLVLGTYYTLYAKKKTHLFRKNVREALEQWITDVILSDSVTNVVVPDHLAPLFKHSYIRQMLIEELVKEKRSFLGETSDNIVKIYDQVGLDGDSRLKLESNKKHLQCQGIHELCVMEQKDYLPKVYRLTNSEDPDVRIEAQTAVIQWYGFRGLRFLDVVTYPITEFQQLKLLELLRPLKLTGLPKLSKWIQSDNYTVADFALKLAEHYKQQQVHEEAVKCLDYPHEAVRVQAVKTLATIGTKETADLLTKTYYRERFTNRLNILTELPKLAGNDQRDFLISQLHEGHEYLKIAAARALAKCTEEGMEILEAKAYEEPIPYKQIYLHIKAEMAK